MDINLDLKKEIANSPWIKCEDNNYLFDNSTVFKRLSPLISPTGEEEIIPAQVIVCRKCGKIPAFFFDMAKELPIELRSTCGLSSFGKK